MQALHQQLQAATQQALVGKADATLMQQWHEALAVELDRRARSSQLTEALVQLEACLAEQLAAKADWQWADVLVEALHHARQLHRAQGAIALGPRQAGWA